MNKAQARKAFLNKRNNLTESEIQNLDMRLLSHFKQLDLSGIHFLHLFLPITAKKEVNTFLLANWIRQTHPEIKLVLAKSDFENHSLSHFIWEADTPLVENTYGIIEPQSGKELQAKEVDLILIPLLAFDKQGQRIGYGKGFYDRFLAECQPNAQKIGLSYFEPILQIEDINSYDIKLNACITPEKIWQF